MLTFWPIISIILIPLSIVGMGGLFARKKSFFIESLIFGFSIVVVLLSTWGLIVPHPFQQFSWTLFIIGILGFFKNYFLFRKELLLFFKNLLYVKSNTSLVILISKGLVLAFILKLVIFSLLRPIIDPDVVNYYLPFARSLIKSGRIPTIDFYTDLPLSNTSLGSLVVYGYSLAIGTTKNIISFRLIPLFLILGIGVYWYKFIRKLSSSLLITWLSIGILVSLPIADSILFEILFYPDYLFVLLFLYIIGFLQNSKSLLRQKQNLFFLTMVIGAFLLSKFQATLLLLLSVGFIITSFLKGNMRKTLILLSVFLVFGFRLINQSYFNLPDLVLFVVSPLILGGLLFKIPTSSYRLKLNKKNIAKTIG